MTEAALAQVSNTSAPDYEPQPARNVLVVEDDAAFRFLCASAIRNRNPRYTATEADCAEQALEVFTTQQFDCVVVDYNLPDATGAYLIEKLRSTHPDWLGPVIVMTSGGSEDVVAEALRAGAADYMAKQQFNESAIGRAIDNAIEKSELERAVVLKNDELLAANASLERRSAEITNFYHTISHEIKTPLTAARMFLSMLHEGLAGEMTEQQREIAAQAMESCDQITQQFNELVECTRLESRKLRLETAEQDIRPLVRRSVVSVMPAAAARRIEIFETIDAAVPQMCVDGGRIVQILANLLGNAVKFTQPGGRVSIEVRVAAEDKRSVQIDVCDSGVGIAPEHLDRIFDRLYQVADTGDALMGAGLGLGLSIAKDLTELHGGSIAVSSKPGEGTTFRLSLPVDSRPALQE